MSYFVQNDSPPPACLSDIVVEEMLYWENAGQAGVAQAGVHGCLLGQVVGGGASKPKQQHRGRGRSCRG